MITYFLICLFELLFVVLVMAEERATGESNSEPSLSSSSSEDEEQYRAGDKCRRKQSKTFFEGQARKPYRFRKRQRRSLEAEDSDTVIDGECKQCAPTLGNVIEGFRKLTHQGSELKKRKKRYPAPKNADRDHY